MACDFESGMQSQLAQASVHLAGTSPLIIRKMAEKDKLHIRRIQAFEPVNLIEPRNPWEEVIQSAYWISDPPTDYTEVAFTNAIAAGARFGFPANGVKLSACIGAYNRRLIKRKEELYGLFHVTSELVEIIGEPHVREDRVRVGTGGKKRRYRLWFTDWETQFEIIYNTNVLQLKNILLIFEAGGRAAGIGDNRIDKGGPNGGYRVVTVTPM